MKRIAFLVLIFVPCSAILAQKEIGSKVYLYGGVTGKLNGPVVILFTQAEPAIEEMTLSKFPLTGIMHAISYRSLFNKDRHYSEEEFQQVLKDHHIRAIVSISFSDLALERPGRRKYSFTDTVNVGSAYKEFQTGPGVHRKELWPAAMGYAVSLKFEIYTDSDQFARPVGAIFGEATGTSGTSSTTRSISKKIIGRVVSGLETEKAFE